MSILTDEHLCALGRVTVNVAALEQYLRNIIGEMISSDRQVGQIVTSKFSFYESLQTFESLCRREIKRRGDNPALLQRLDMLFDDANRLRDDRNDVIHSAWRADSNSEARILRPDASVRNGRAPTTVSVYLSRCNQRGSRARHQGARGARSACARGATAADQTSTLSEARLIPSQSVDRHVAVVLVSNHELEFRPCVELVI